MRTLILGATGFIGSHITAQAILRGYDVTIGYRETSNFDLFDSVQEYYSKEQNTSEVKDIIKLKELLSDFWSETTALKPYNSKSKTGLTPPKRLLISPLLHEEITADNFDLVINCAAIISFQKSKGPWMIEENIKTTRDIVNACVKGKIPALLHVSSIAALGRPENEKPITINTPWEDSKYNTDYAKSKYLSELEVWRGKEEGLNTIIINPGVVLGYGKGKTSNKQVFDTVSPRNPYYPAGSNGFVFVEDVAFNALTIIENKDFGKRHLFVSHNIPFKELTNSIAKIKNQKPPTKPLKGFAYKTALRIAKFCEFLGIPFPISSELLVSTSKNSVYC